MREIDELAERFWAWRAQTQPRTRDDIPRLRRPEGWLPDVGPQVRDRRRQERADFQAELDALAPVEVADRVDARLLHSALARVRWELDVVRHWTQPRFHVDQALGPVFDVLLPPGVDGARVAEVLRFLANVPAVLDAAMEELPTVAAAEFTAAAIGELDGVAERMSALAAALAGIDPARTDALAAATGRAGAALEGYCDFLVALRPGLPPVTPVGAEAFAWFLAEVACVPLAPEQIRDIGRHEHDRAVVRELLERRRLTGAEPPLPVSAAAQVAAQARAEEQVREFYRAQDLLDQPADLARYLTLPMPAYLEPLRFLGVADDLTGPDRLDEDGIGYVPAPGADLAYFYAANARDPRAGVVHEGVHHQQLALSWRRARPVRRHYYDSGPNEGIAYYNEELMLASGLFDDAPHTRVTMWNFMRLRALRAQVDVGLAIGELDVDAAAELLERTVPMDAATAREEAAFFAETPGQALTYQVGKAQLLALVADAVAVRGNDFDLRGLHDSVWRNGNVPIALQRWEMLGLTDELAAIGMTA